MNRALIPELLLVLAQALASAQQSANSPSQTLRFDRGTLANGTYTNECLGFSFAIPVGWEVKRHSGGADAEGKATHLPSGGLSLVVIDRHSELPLGNRIAVIAIDATGLPMTAKDVVTNSVQGQIKASPQNRQLARDAFAVDYAGKKFFRSDYKQILNNGNTLYLAFVFTKFRGYFIGETLIAGSLEDLDESANSLQRVSFQEDQPNSTCVMGREDSPMSGGIIGGVISSTPVSPQSGSGHAMRVRVSRGVSQGLLVVKVEPQYPVAARQDRIEGLVILQAVIDTIGDVENLTVVSGHPALVPAALDAVKQWKYRPYRLNGQPVKIETQITVSFQLQED